MTAGSASIKDVLRVSGRGLAEDLLNPSLSVKEIASEFVSMLVELAEGSGTLCSYWSFLVRASLAFTTVLGLARESAKRELAEKAAEIMEIGFEVVEELGRDRYSCRALERGLKAIEEILKSVDALLGVAAG